jgi:hypothetical protein
VERRFVENICWKLQKVTLKRMSKARQMAIAKLVHNLAFTLADEVRLKHWDCTIMFDVAGL